MVVMETVRAATLASSRKKDRLAAEHSQPLATSSPSGKSSLPIDVCPPSPILLPGNSPNIPEELVRYRNQTYVAPEKLQIVKPLEGSVTLLKWKLLASPQLGGATSFFSDASRPGVHMKKWKAGGVIDEGRPRLAGTKMKSLSTADISRLEHNLTYPPYPHPSGGNDWTNVSHESHSLHSATESSKNPHTKSGTSNPYLAPEAKLSSSSTTKPKSSNKSILSQVGTLLGTGWSRLGFSGNTTSTTTETGESTLETEDIGLAAALKDS